MRLAEDPENLIPKPFREQRWWLVMEREQRDRAVAFLVYLSELSRFLGAARKNICSNGVLGVVMGDPETCHHSIPLTELTRHLAQQAGWTQAFPDLTSTLRRRFQARVRRSSTNPIRGGDALDVYTGA